MRTPEIRSYDTIEQMQQDISANLEIANSRLHPRQEAITYCSTWARFYDIAERVVIFGKVSTIEQLRQGCIASGGTTEEADFEIEHTVASENDGMLFGWCWSIWEDAGELGFTHRFDMWPIGQELFDAAMTVAWNIDALPLEHQMALAVAYEEYRQHVRTVL